MSKLYDLLSAMCGKIKKPNWNQNDPTAPDYVKNRPFYTEIKEMTVEGDDVNLPEFPIFSVGDNVVVNVDGVEYSCTAVEEDSNIFIGDSSADIEEDKGQFGWQIYVWNANVTFYSHDTHTVSYQYEDIHKLDKKFVDNAFLSQIIDPTTCCMWCDYLGNTDGYQNAEMEPEDFYNFMNAVRWGLKNNAIFYSFYLGCGWHVEQNIQEIEGHYRECVYLTTSYYGCGDNGVTHYNITQTYYIDDNGVTWFEYITNAYPIQG